MLKITAQPIGEGRERACYVHPEDPRLGIKIPSGKVTAQTRREIDFYCKLKKRGVLDNPHIPKYYGLCETSIGAGIVVQLIRNYDGEISRPLNWYLAQGVPVDEFHSYLEELKESLLQDLIIFNHDMQTGNMLLHKTSMGSARLVIIDGLGDTVALDWLDKIPFLVRRKINRRWKRFIKRVNLSQEVRAQRAAEPTSKSQRS